MGNSDLREGSDHGREQRTGINDFQVGHIKLPGSQNSYRLILVQFFDTKYVVDVTIKF